MRTVKITCNRCGREITGYPVSIVPIYTEFWRKLRSRERRKQKIIVKTEKKREKKEKTSNKKSQQKKLDMGKIFALKDAGWTYKQIAEEFGTTENSIAVSIYNYKKKNDKE